MKKLLLLTILLSLSACFSSKKIDTREEKRSKSIERLDESQESTEELFNEME
jgi:hypothetical protein